MPRTALLAVMLVCASLLARLALAAGYTWQDTYAKVLPTGALEWTPQPFAFEKGASVRYIDFADGRDDRDGLTPDTAWKHHPWDPAAAGQARQCTGIQTYVFKRGVEYRGALVAAESGEAGNPIRLTSDPAWGTGEAVFTGADRVTSRWTPGAEGLDFPDAESVWYTDLDFAPRNVWLVDDAGKATRLALARTPNWKVSDPDDIKSEWWQFLQPKNQWTQIEKIGNNDCPQGMDATHLTNAPDYYKGAYVWSEYGWVMGTPYPSRIVKYTAADHAIVFGGQWSSAAGKYNWPRFTRYYLEDKPQYLDEAGEFWFDKKENGGRLYVRLPGDLNPNKARIEAGRRLTLIDSERMSHVHISGLTFRFVNTWWDLDAPPTVDKDVDPACIRLLGSGDDLQVANCRFEHVHMPVFMKAIGDEAAIDHVVVRDNEISETDHGAMLFSDGGGWGMEYPKGQMYDVKVLRNRLREIGKRPTRYGQGHAIHIECAETVEVAGNIMDRLYGSGIFVYGAKRSAAKVDRPLSRVLIHHNQVVDSLLNNNDWGGIETWQGGPAYVYGNVSGNPGGFKLWGNKLHAGKPGNSRFGHAFYMDGGYKQYYFNNIAWGKSKDPLDRLGNTSAFQEIQGYLATIFNNTVYNFVQGSRRQAPGAGRNKYLGNIWDGIGEIVFRHADSYKSMAEPNAADASSTASTFRHESNAYADNVFFDIPEKIAVFESTGNWYPDLPSFQKAIAARKSMGTVGKMAASSPLVAPEKHDFRPTAEAKDSGVTVFVPWGLYGTVGEWHFYPAGDDPTRILDEQLYLAPNYVDRQDYHKQPVYPLKVVNGGADAYVQGPLEDWTKGALHFNGGTRYAVVSRAELSAGPAEDEPYPIKNTPSDWATFEAPQEIEPGKPFEVKITLHGVEPGVKVAADLHWNAGKTFRGMNSWGGEAKAVNGDGPYTFKFTPKDGSGLTHFTVTAWVSPTGGWKDQTKIARHAILRSKAVYAGNYPSPAVSTNNFLVEAYLRTAPGHKGGLLIGKADAAAGYELAVNDAGGVTFLTKGGGAAAQVASRVAINDGKWHSVIAEADRRAGTLAVYVDGKADGSGAGLKAGVPLTSDADLYVGGTPQGRGLDGDIDFMRVTIGTLADAKTSIDELHAWQFDGPFLRDWNGARPADGKRDAGAIEAAE